MLRIQRKKEKKCIKCFVTTQLNLITGRGRILNSNNLSSEKRLNIKILFRMVSMPIQSAAAIYCKH